MKNQTYILTGLAIGEETKGASVEWLSQITKAHTVLRSGGSQAGHHIIRLDGREQMFSHFGCGTFNGAKTHLKHMVINPIDLFTEALELEEKGVSNPFDLITISSDCLTVTPFHGAMSRLKEKLREIKKGTIGKGVGDAIKDAKSDRDLAIYAGDFLLPQNEILEKVERIRQHKLKQAFSLFAEMELEELPDDVYSEMKLLHDHTLSASIAESFSLLSDLVKIVDEGEFDSILNSNGTIVGEPSHGALLHPWYGFVPHTTQIDPTSQDVLNTLKQSNYLGRIIRLGISRSYMTRHGAGPLVSFNADMTQQIQETHNNAGNEWLGEFRNGNYDLVAMNYAIEVSGGKANFDGLMISYMDTLSKFAYWDICEAYEYTGTATDVDEFFEITDGKITSIKIHPNTQDQKHYEHQARLTQLLNECKPILKRLLPTEDKSLEEVFIDYVEQNLNIPVVVTSHGPRASDRQIRKGYEHLFYPIES